ncbi:Glucocorticoid receptor [Chelonia mydas]|uniref:Glucocorticoid receptor n=1 Tax=Chelonia mydas TaxID=8469 RepID=M7B9J0_CHEMY|nr:Glucocorticoid receptor [Chelonia mydas]
MDPKESLSTSDGEEAGKNVHFSDKGRTVMDFRPTFRGGATVRAPASTSPLPASSQSDSKQQSVLGDFSKGLVSNAPQPDLSKAVLLSMGLYMGETESKVMGNELGFPQQGQIGISSGETDFRLLEESIASLNKSSSLAEGSKGTVSVGVPLEQDFPIMANSSLPLGQAGTNGGNLKLFSEDQSTFDILQDLELPPVSPGKEPNGSPWRLDPLLDEGDLLSPMTADEAFLLEGNASEDCKPPILPDTKPKINEHGDLSPSPKMQMPQVKTEKEDFIELCTPGVIKQEKMGPVYCQANFSGSNLMGNKMSAISVHGVSTSGGQLYHYDLNTASLSQQQDQKPVFNVIPSLPAGSENWNRCQGSGDDNMTPLGTLNFSGRPVFSNGYLRWSTGVDRRVIRGQFSGSSVDPRNRPLMHRSPRIDPPDVHCQIRQISAVNTLCTVWNMPLSGFSGTGGGSLYRYGQRMSIRDYTVGYIRHQSSPQSVTGCCKLTFKIYQEWTL